MKKILLNLLLICAVSVAFAMPAVNEKVLKQFAANFPNAENAKWFEHEHHYDVYFDKDEVKYQVRYDRNGKIISTRNYYRSHKLCPFIKSKVTEKFPGKSIFGVTEITNSDEMFYVIALEDSTSWTNIRVDATGDMSVLQKMKKSE
jgi:hypothetical protein